MSGKNLGLRRGKQFSSLSSSSFSTGDRVQARFNGKIKYFPGKIKSVNRDGTYKIEYDDGDTEVYILFAA